MTTQKTYGWAYLDESNASHYGRGKPAELIRAEEDVEIEDARLDIATDEYYEHHYGEVEYERRMRQCRVAAERAQNIYIAVYLKFYGGRP